MIPHIMMDATPLYPKPYHPAEPFRFRDFSLDSWFPGLSNVAFPGFPRHYTRTQRPVKYYFTGLGSSRRYNPDDGILIPIGDQKIVPDYLASLLDRCDPFARDVYNLGDMIRMTFLTVRRSRDLLLIN
jgi:hypothetical protein